MTVAVERRTRLEQHIARLQDNGIVFISYFRVEDILEEIIRCGILHRHSGTIHQIDYGSRVRIVVTAEVIQEGSLLCQFRSLMGYGIRKGGNLHIFILLYAPCLERTHINGTANLTRVTEHIAVVCKIDNLIINSIFKQSR